MKVEILATRISDQDQGPGGSHYRASKGDVLTVPDAYGRKLCILGWAKDVTPEVAEEDRVPTGEFKPGGRSLAKVLKKSGLANEEIENDIPDAEIESFRKGKLGKDGEVQAHGGKHAAKAVG